jgi:hypothetical protein
MLRIAARTMQAEHVRQPLNRSCGGPGRPVSVGTTNRRRMWASHNGDVMVSPAPGQCGHVAIGSAMSGKGMPAIPRPQENEGVGEHVRTRFHFGRKASREIAEPENRTCNERRKLVSSAGPDLGSNPAKRTIRPLT